MDSSSPPEYRSYLLRLWRDNPRAPWRASLQSTATGGLEHFADIDSLFAFLVAQADALDPLQNDNEARRNVKGEEP